MKTLNEKMAELMGWTLIHSPEARYFDGNTVVIMWAHEWHPNSDLNQASDVAIKLNLEIRYGQGWAEVWNFYEPIRAKMLHNNTPADIARVICEGIREIMGGGDE
jgi:hypothetical protein